MNRPLSLVLLALFGLFFLALFWTGKEFYSYATAPDKLTLDGVTPLTAVLNDPAEIELSGQGFGPDTRVFMHMDVNNQSAVVGSLPFNDIIFDMELVDDKMYLASNTKGLLTLDVSNPLKPTFLSRFFLSRSAVLDIERKDNILFLSSGNQGLKVVEIREGGLLKHRKSLPTWSTALESKAVDSYLYVAAGKAGLLCYDLDKLETKKPFHVVETTASARGVEVYERHLYVAAGREGVLIYKLNEYGIPELENVLATEANARSVKIAEDSLYVLGRGSIDQYQLNDPATPNFLVRQSHFSTPQRLFFDADKIYVSDNESGLGIIESKNKMISGKVDVLNLGGDPRTVHAVGKWLYVVVSRVGIKIIDAKSILARHVVRSVDTVGVVTDIKKHADHMFIVDSKEGVVIRNNASGSESRMKTTVPAKRLYFSGDKMIVSGTKSGLEFYDLADAEKPELYEFWPDLAVNDVLVIDDYLIAGNNTTGLSLFKTGAGGQLLDQRSDVLTSKLLTHKNIIIAAGETHGVTFFSINKEKLVKVGQIDLPFPTKEFAGAVGLAVQKNQLFVANGDGGLLILDISDLAAPRNISTLWLPGFARSLFLEGDLLYISSRYSGLHTVDISDVSKPRLVDTVPIYDLSGGVEMAGDRLYLGNRYMGVTIIPRPKEIKNIKVVSPHKIKIKMPASPEPGRYSFYVSNGRGGAGYGGAVAFR